MKRWVGNCKGDWEGVDRNVGGNYFKGCFAKFFILFVWKVVEFRVFFVEINEWMSEWIKIKIFYYFWVVFMYTSVYLVVIWILEEDLRLSGNFVKLNI